MYLKGPWGDPDDSLDKKEKEIVLSPLFPPDLGNKSKALKHWFRINSQKPMPAYPMGNHPGPHTD